MDKRFCARAFMAAIYTAAIAVCVLLRVPGLLDFDTFIAARLHAMSFTFIPGTALVMLDLFFLGPSEVDIRFVTNIIIATVAAFGFWSDVILRRLSSQQLIGHILSFAVMGFFSFVVISALGNYAIDSKLGGGAGKEVFPWIAAFCGFLTIAIPVSFYAFWHKKIKSLK